MYKDYKKEMEMFLMAKNIMTEKFPTLYRTIANGLIMRWDIQVRRNPKNVPDIYCTHGVIDGKRVEESRLIREGKNIGKANETAPWEQAVREAQSEWNLKKDKGYRETPDSKDKPILPMLAKEYSKCRHRIKTPCHVQPKLNGVRCISSLRGGVPFMMSRGGKPVLKFAHIREEIGSLLGISKMNGVFLDGEIFKTGMSLQVISGASRKAKDDVREDVDSAVEYHVYDCFNPKRKDWPFAERSAFLKTLIKGGKLKHIRFVETVLVKNEAEALAHYDTWLKQGFEGMMFRNSDSPYRIGHRSMDLQKHKPFVDAEFEIVGAHEGSGNDAGSVVWECITKEKRKFSAKPEGDRETRKWYWKHWKEFVGKKLTVKYQELSDDGVPIFPVGVVIRDYE
jgi:DNA ligase-1